MNQVDILTTNNQKHPQPKKRIYVSYSETVSTELNILRALYTDVYMWFNVTKCVTACYKDHIDLCCGILLYFT